jgi:hypothetical protein
MVVAKLVVTPECALSILDKLSCCLTATGRAKAELAAMETAGGIN